MVSFFLVCVVVVWIDCARSPFMSLYIDTRRTLSFDDRGWEVEIYHPVPPGKYSQLRHRPPYLEKSSFTYQAESRLPKQAGSLHMLWEDNKNRKKAHGTYNHEGKTPHSPSPHFSPSLFWLASFLSSLSLLLFSFSALFYILHPPWFLIWRTHRKNPPRSSMKNHHTTTHILSSPPFSISRLSGNVFVLLSHFYLHRDQPVFSCTLIRTQAYFRTLLPALLYLFLNPFLYFVAICLSPSTLIFHSPFPPKTVSTVNT